MPTAFMSMLPRPCATGLLRPKRLFEVDGTTGGAPSSHCGLEARGGHGLPPACLSRHHESYKGDRRRRWRGQAHAPRLGSPPPPCFAWSPSPVACDGGGSHALTRSLRELASPARGRGAYAPTCVTN